MSLGSLPSGPSITAAREEARNTDNLNRKMNLEKYIILDMCPFSTSKQRYPEENASSC